MDFVAATPAHAETAVSGQAAELSVLTYNVRGLPWPVAAGRGDALRRIGRELAEMRAAGQQPDVVLIQEGFRDEVAELYRQSGYRFWVRGPSRGGAFGKLTNGGLHIFSDEPIVDVRTIAYTSCAGFDCLANKGAMLARIQPEGAPTAIEVVNTHMNARGAAHAPAAQTLAAHNAQTAQLYDFIAREHDPNVPLLVGGDFNVKNDTNRYDYKSTERPYRVVSEFCSQAGSGCGAGAGDTTAKPWLKSQDLQAFAEDADVHIRPLQVAGLFDARNGDRLSDHDGYLVRYRLTWTPPVRERQAIEVRPKPLKLGLKVTWTPGAPDEDGPALRGVSSDKSSGR